MASLETFKEISIGGLTKDQLLRELGEAGVQFNEYARALFGHPLFSPSEKPEKVALVKLKPSDLRLTNPCSFQEIVARASGLGLRLCPLSLGAFLRLQYLDQPEGPYLTIASPKLEKDAPNGFYIRNHESSLWLRGYRADDPCVWPEHNEFVFLASV